MNKLEGKTILVTGATGKVGIPLIERLAKDNEIWGVARFSNPAKKNALEAIGVNARAVDLENPDFSELPEKVDHVIHLGGDVCQGNEQGFYMPNGVDFFMANQVNGVATGKLMSRFRSAQSCLVVSSTAVYEMQSAEEIDNQCLVDENGRLGCFHAAVPQYSSSKQSQEVIARFCAEEFGLPTTIARLAIQIGSVEGGTGAGYVGAIAAGLPFPAYHADCRSFAQFIHDDDIFDLMPGLLSVASTKAETFNLAGSEVVDLKELASYVAKRLGKDSVDFIQDPIGFYATLIDTTKLNEEVGVCKAGWKEAIDRVIDDLMPESPRC